MLTDGHCVFAVSGDPAARGDTAVEEEKYRRVKREALEAELRRDDARFGWLAVNASRRGGGELNAADLIDKVCIFSALF